VRLKSISCFSFYAACMALKRIQKENMQNVDCNIKKQFLLASVALAAGLLSASVLAKDLRVIVHSSFDLPKPLLAKFESEAGVKLKIVKGGDSGEMLNKLILTRKAPIADVVYGIDNAQAVKAKAADVLDMYDGASAQVESKAEFAGMAVAVDYGFVTLNYDKATVAKRGTPLPKSLEELTQPAYKKWLVVENPATSGPGYAFLLATIAHMGEEKAFAWWKSMRANDMKVAKGWTEAYYTDFSRNGGAYPIVVSYASSPAAEVFYSKDKLIDSPTASLFLPGAVFKQVEGVALIKGGKQRAEAEKFLEFMRSNDVQEAMQTTMWMFPMLSTTKRADVMKYAPEPAKFESMPATVIAEKGAGWISRWTKTVLK
jgi:thiamine transport system substrate-binding protein